ncbi:InlB B-repeat-containing protein [Acholeplasma vituli]|uniref:InlB B-repeat-containing protein n=1 Tax=Paracholeplasma vituli TaxID=69473 RepID=A0ABT2PXF6_9MOLU|nr:InlB B-repeat-containing protein [Paracholeplasma vituli]MCU0105639.1 InlB B-repeat-containing protein [Paracholeplasma vituli]
MSNDLGIKGTDFVTYKGQMQLPAGYTVVEYGFIFSRSSDVLTLESAGATIVPSNINYGPTGEFMRSFPNTTFNSLRAYLIVLNGSSVEETYYSENYYRSISELGEPGTYSASFDSSTKGSYNLGDVTVSGVVWSLNDALIGADSNKVGDKSVRLRNSMWTKSGFANISTISFKAALWSGDDVNTLKISLSSDGSNWIDVSDGLNQTEVSSLTLVDYTFNLANSANFNSSGLKSSDLLLVKIQVELIGERINIDEISINYGAFNGAIHEVELVSGTTSKDFYADGTIFTNPTPSTGYKFDGWFKDSNFATPYNNTGIKESLSLYAKFIKETYTITFNYNGADAGNTVASIQAEYEDEIDLPVPSKSGYDFAGWESSTGATQYSSPYIVEAANRDMYAKWILNDSGKVSLDKASLSLPLNVTNTTPLTLPLVGDNGTTISWVSSNTDYITNNGTVTLPTESAVEVTLTATISLNSASETRIFTITVKPEETSIPEVLRQSDFGTTNLTNTDYTAVKTTSVLNGAADPTPSGNSSWITKGSNYNGTGWDYVRMGGKPAATIENPTVYMSTNYILSGTVTSIVIKIVGLDSAAGNETIYLQTSDNNSTWTNVTSLSVTAIGDLKFEGLNLSNVYYRFVFVRASSGNDNRGTDIKSITFYGNP